MIRYLFVLCALLLAACSNPDADNKAPEGQMSASIVQNPYTASGVDSSTLAHMPVLVFEDTVYHFGAIKEGDRVSHTFTFRNAGGSPLVISSTDASCGCTVADYPREPVAPGATGEITVQFSSAGRPGHQEKAVSVLSNAQGALKNLYITADVSPQ